MKQFKTGNIVLFSLFFILLIILPKSYSQDAVDYKIDNYTIGIAQNLSAKDDMAPYDNVTNLFNLLFNGTENFFGADDVVVIKISASFPEQGYTNSNCLKALIESILNRQGGFNGAVVVIDNIHSANPDKDISSGWAADSKVGNTRHNGESLNSVIAKFEKTGKVFKVHIEDSAINPDKWIVLDSNNPDYRNLPKGKNGWLRYRTTIPDSGRDVTLSVPVFSLPDGKVIDLSKKGGVFVNGKKNAQQLRFIIASPLNYYSKNIGVQGAITSHLGLVELPGGRDPKKGIFEDGSMNLYTLGFSDNKPELTGAAIGSYINNNLYPAVYLCCAEWIGQAGIFGAGTATQRRTIAICKDPVTLDYYMGKFYLFDSDRQRLWNNPDSDSSFGKILRACNKQKVGTVDENSMIILLYDADNPPTRVYDWRFIQ